MSIEDSIVGVILEQDCIKLLLYVIVVGGGTVGVIVEAINVGLKLYVVELSIEGVNPLLLSDNIIGILAARYALAVAEELGLTVLI